MAEVVLCSPSKMMGDLDLAPSEVMGDLDLEPSEVVQELMMESSGELGWKILVQGLR